MGIDRVVSVIKQWRNLAIVTGNVFLCGAATTCHDMPTQKITTTRLDSTLHDDSTSDFNHLFLLCQVERVCRNSPGSLIDNLGNLR